MPRQEYPPSVLSQAAEAGGALPLGRREGGDLLQVGFKSHAANVGRPLVTGNQTILKSCLSDGLAACKPEMIWGELHNRW